MAAIVSADVVGYSKLMGVDETGTHARLQEIATPGGLCISAKVYDEVAGKLDVDFADGGARSMKNIALPIQVWNWLPGGGQTQASEIEPELALPDKPSIAVLPFENMSRDPEQDYFVDGVVEDILTTQARVLDLFVIARNSSFTYKGKAVDVRQVGRELGVKYVVEGSLRKAGNRVRVTAQLVECASGGHVWANRYDGELDDVFGFQDRITQEIVTALEVSLTHGEHVRIWRKKSGSPLFYEALQKAMVAYAEFSRQSIQELDRALAINHDYPPALYLYAFNTVDQARFGWTEDRDAAFATALDMARRALAIDPLFAEAYSAIGYAQTFQGRHDEAVEAVERSVELGPNDGGVCHCAAMSHVFAGNFEMARDYEEQAIRLNPIAREVSLIDLARAHYHLSAYEEARRHAVRALEKQPL